MNNKKNRSFSIVIPVFNESQNIINLIKEINLSIDKKYTYEIVIVNDSSNDDTEELLLKYNSIYKFTLIKNKKNMGQSFSIHLGIKNSLFDHIVTIDGDGQNNPKDINNLLEIYFSTHYSLVGGIREKRKDTVTKRITSIFANKIRNYILKDGCPDTGCSLKVFEKNIFLNFPYFNGVHRFLPALFKGYGNKTFFVNVDHRQRVFGKSNYGTFDRFFKGVRDIIKVIKILKKVKK